MSQLVKQVFEVENNKLGRTETVEILDSFTKKFEKVTRVVIPQETSKGVGL